jgi:hypothetical protein
VEKPREERILTREESLASGGVYKSPTPAVDSPSSQGVYRVPTAEHDMHKHELARKSTGIDPGTLKLVIFVTVLLVVGLGATAMVVL